jgi:uncharacterized protein
MGDMSNEPSMEDILASIKKIIADDGDRKLAPPLARRPALRNSELEELQDARTAEAAADDAADNADDVFELKVEAIAPEETQPPLTTLTLDSSQEIVSDAAAAASRNALSSLSRMTVKPEVNGSDTLEGMVREMLRPMLKDWLDANLPQLVEGLVSKEIARITGKTLI